MSAAVHTGECHFFLTEMPHRELLVAGPAATRVFELEDLAMADQIVLSAEAAAEVDAGWLDDETMGAARVLSRVTPGSSRCATLSPGVTGAHLDEYVPAPLRAHLAVSSGEAEHRQVTVAFVKLSGTDELIVSDGPSALLIRIDKLAAAVGRACETYGLTWLESDIDIGAVKLYLTGGAPSSSGQDEEGMLRALREIVADRRRPVAPRRREPRACLHGRHRQCNPADVRGYGGCCQRRCTTHGSRRARRHPRHRGRARPGEDDLRDREGAAPRQGQGRVLSWRTRSGSPSARATSRRWIRRLSSGGNRSSTYFAPPLTRPGCVASRLSNSSARPASASHDSFASCER